MPYARPELEIIFAKASYRGGIWGGYLGVGIL